MFRYLAAQTKTPICCHLDHGFSYRECKEGIDSGFTSVMFDGSKMTLKKTLILALKFLILHINIIFLWKVKLERLIFKGKIL